MATESAQKVEEEVLTKPVITVRPILDATWRFLNLDGQDDLCETRLDYAREEVIRHACTWRDRWGRVCRQVNTVRHIRYVQDAPRGPIEKHNQKVKLRKMSPTQRRKTLARRAYTRAVAQAQEALDRKVTQARAEFKVAVAQAALGLVG